MQKSKEININGEYKLYELIKSSLKNNVSNSFTKIFENNEELTVDKTFNIFNYYLKIIFNKVKNELQNYQEELDENTKKAINKYYQKIRLLSKKIFARAIRLFVTLVLFREKDKENIIKFNYNNLLNYLKIPDLWPKYIYNNKNFIKNINELISLCNIHINQALALYEFLGKDIDDKYFEDVIQKIKMEEKLKEEGLKVQQGKRIDDEGEDKDGKDIDNSKDDDD